MKTLFEHIEHVKRQPHPVRKQIAFASAIGLTAFIALVWFAGSLTTGAFAIEISVPGEQAPVAAQRSAEADAGLAGAAAALPAAEAPSRIEIVDAPSAKQKPPEQTTLPF